MLLLQANLPATFAYSGIYAVLTDAAVFLGVFFIDRQYSIILVLPCRSRGMLEGSEQAVFQLSL